MCPFKHSKKKTPWSKNDWWLGSQATEGLQHGMLTPGMPGTGGGGVGLSIIKRNLWKKNSKMSRNLRIQIFIWWLDYVFMLKYTYNLRQDWETNQLRIGICWTYMQHTNLLVATLCKLATNQLRNYQLPVAHRFNGGDSALSFDPRKRENKKKTSGPCLGIFVG